jgi:hypothetical protein
MMHLPGAAFTLPFYPCILPPRCTVLPRARERLRHLAPPPHRRRRDAKSPRPRLPTPQHFHSRHGKAYLFNQVVNVVCGPQEERLMTTGQHTVADLFCVGCLANVGWKYVGGGGGGALAQAGRRAGGAAAAQRPSPTHPL